MLSTYLYTTRLVCRPVFQSSVAYNSNLKRIFNKLEKKRMENIKLNGNSKKTNEDMDKLTPAEINLIILGNGAVAAPKSIYISTTDNNYLIGSSENVYRLSYQQGIKSFKPKHLFITSTKWQNIGGLIGLGMNMEVAGHESLTVHGTSNLEDLFSSSRLFGISAGIKLICNPLDNEFKDNCFAVNKIELDLKDENNFKRQKTGSQIEKKVFNFHFKINDRAGRLDLNKCIELKIPVGPLLRKLKNGESIELGDKVIKHEDVCAPALPGDEFLVIDCPTSDYLGSLKRNEYLNNLIEEKNPRLKYVFHFSDIDVILDKEYQEWTNKFAPHVQHFGLNEYCSSLAFLPNHKQSYSFNKIDPDLFRTLYFTDQPKELPFESRIKQADQLQVENLGFKKQLPRTLVKNIMDYKELDKEFDDAVGMDEAIKEYREKTKSIKNEIVYPEITFTGTASAAPGKYRNSSGIFISLNENETCILDCGEGTLYGLIHNFGPDKYLEKLNQLKFIYVSHLHADHHIGLINILVHYRKSFSQLNKKPKEKLRLFVPNAVSDFLSLYNLHFEPIDDLYEIVANPVNNMINLSKEDANKFGLEEMAITRVPHCFQSTGIALKTKDSKGNDYKITYSGDTLPGENLIKIGKDCDLLIHEATFSEHFESEALKKRHSTTEQAIEQGKKMNAKFTLLTHYSQRFSKLPPNSKSYTENVGTAFDFLTVNPSTLKKTAYFKDVAKVLYKEAETDINLKIENRMRQNKLVVKYAKNQRLIEKYSEN